MGKDSSYEARTTSGKILDFTVNVAAPNVGHPNRDKPEARQTRAIVGILLLISAGLVAMDDTLGLHAVSLQGEKRWTNRAYAPLLSVAQSHKLPVIGRCAYVTGRGGICPITHDGIDGLIKSLVAKNASGAPPPVPAAVAPK